jgi:hypothetical protein
MRMRKNTQAQYPIESKQKRPLPTGLFYRPLSASARLPDTYIEMGFPGEAFSEELIPKSSRYPP